MGFFDKFKKNKKIDWEEEQLKSLNLQRLKASVKTPTIHKEPWTMIESQGGNTEDKRIWFKKSKLSYVSEVYTDGPKNTWFFDIILDGQKITKAFISFEDAVQQKLIILDIPHDIDLGDKELNEGVKDE
jgi:hypothetical protein